jgi:hypothetical protein
MNVVIKRRVAAHNIDALNRAVVATVDLENGSIFTLSARSENEAEGEVWKATEPTVGAKNVWMAKSSEVTITTIGADTGADVLQMKGIVEDPRMFTNVKGLVFDAFKPQVADIIEMTLGDDEKEYLVADASYTLKADTAAGDGFAMHKVGTSILHIGSAKLVKTPVKTYIYEVVAN